MEYVQTVLVQIAATKLAEATGPQGLLTALEAHRDSAAGQRGFQGMRVTRTANPEGNILVVAETRWANNNAMADYSTLKNNVESIIKRPRERDRRRTACRFTGWSRSRASPPTRRTASTTGWRWRCSSQSACWPSRCSASTGSPVSTWRFPRKPRRRWPPASRSASSASPAYFSSNPSAPRWQILGVVVIAVGTLAIGGTAAAIYDEDNKEVHSAETPVATAPAGRSTPVAPGAVEIDMEDNKFTNPDITVKTGEHDRHPQQGRRRSTTSMSPTHRAPIRRRSARPQVLTLAPSPAAISGGADGTIAINLPAGTYDYRCDFHVAEKMFGKLTVQ